MAPVFEKAFADFFEFIGSGVRFLLGLLSCVALASIPVVGEVLDDLTTYKDSPIDWLHVIKIFWPAVGAALTGYLGHLYLVNQALHTEVPPNKD